MAVLFSLVALAALLRFSTIGVQSFWDDEAVTAYLMRMPFGDMLSVMQKTESTPPVYYVAAWGWGKVFGTGEAGLRALSALFGTAAVPAAWAAARKLAGQRAGIVAAALTATSPLLIWYSQEARAYSLLVASCTFSFLCFVYAKDSGTARALAAWAVTSALAIASHYYAFFVVGPEAAWLLVVAWRRRDRVPTIAACSVVAVTGLALAPLAVSERNHGGANWVNDTSLAYRVRETVRTDLVGPAAPHLNLLSLLCAAAVVVGCYSFLRRAGRDEHRAAALAAGGGVVAVVVPLLLALAGFDYFYFQYVIAAMPLLLVAGGVVFGHGRRLGAAAAAGLCLIGVAVTIAVDTDPDLRRENWRSAARALAERPARREVVLTPGPGFVPANPPSPLELYLPHSRRPRLHEQLREVAILDTTRGADRGAPPAPLPGFRPAWILHRPDFDLFDYRAATPQVVSTLRLRRAGLGRFPAVVLQTG